MPQLTCPRCKATVQVVEGAVPVCPSCGLGTLAEQQANGHHAPPPDPDAKVPHASKGGGWKIPVTVGVVVVLGLTAVAALLLAGDGGPRELSQEEAERVASLAMSDFAQDVASVDGGGVRQVVGDFSFEESELGGAGSMRMEMEWGRDDSGRFLMEVSSEGAFSFSFRMEGYCSPERDVLVVGGEAYEVRPSDGPCIEAGMGGSGFGDAGALDVTSLDDPEDLNVTPNPDGTVTATFSDANGNYTVLVDAEGRVERIDLEAPGGGGFFAVSYGAPRAITVPAADERFPSSVGGFCFVFDGACTYRASGGDDAPVSDFEVRVYEGDTPEDDPDAVPVARFDLDGGTQSSGGYRFLPVLDGNGTFGDGDAFQVRGPTTASEFEVVVWDTWADRDVQDVPAPGPGLGWLLVGLAAVALLRRR